MWKRRGKRSSPSSSPQSARREASFSRPLPSTPKSVTDTQVPERPSQPSGCETSASSDTCHEQKFKHQLFPVSSDSNAVVSRVCSLPPVPDFQHTPTSRRRAVSAGATDFNRQRALYGVPTTSTQRTPPVEDEPVYDTIESPCEAESFYPAGTPRTNKISDTHAVSAPIDIGPNFTCYRERSSSIGSRSSSSTPPTPRRNRQSIDSRGSPLPCQRSPRLSREGRSQGPGSPRLNRQSIDSRGSPLPCQGSPMLSRERPSQDSLSPKLNRGSPKFSLVSRNIKSVKQDETAFELPGRSLRRPSMVELSTICATTGETQHWEPVQDVNVPYISDQDAESLLIRHEHGPGTFFFREYGGNVVLTLWDGARCLHFDVRQDAVLVDSGEFTGAKFRAFVRNFRGGSSGSLPVALRYLVVIDTSIVSKCETNFSVQPLFSQRDCVPATTAKQMNTVADQLFASKYPTGLSIPKSSGIFDIPEHAGTAV